MPVMESGDIGISMILKFGWFKIITLGAALVGAALMAVFRPPKNRKEMFLQALTALGASLLFGTTATNFASYYLPFTMESEMVHGLVGAFSWGVFGGIAHLRDSLAEKSMLERTAQTIKDIASVFTKDR